VDGGGGHLSLIAREVEGTTTGVRAGARARRGGKLFDLSADEVIRIWDEVVASARFLIELQEERKIAYGILRNFDRYSFPFCSPDKIPRRRTHSTQDIFFGLATKIEIPNVLREHVEGGGSKSTIDN
jgi:hypothetical protein